MHYKYIVLILSLCNFVPLVHAELLIVKKGADGGFVPLDDSDRANEKKITDIILKYQWPMVIASSLTKEEQDALLTADKPYAEDIFIQDKIQKEVSENYGVIFIPTALYELFCIAHFFIPNLLKQNTYKGWIALEDLLNENDTSANIRKKIYALYQEANSIFFNKEKNIYFNINNSLATSLVTKLFNQYPELKTINKSSELSDALENKQYDILLFLINMLKQFLTPISRITNINYYEIKSNINMLIKSLNEDNENIINDVVTLEYEARELNKALLLRGTSFEKFDVGIGKELFAQKQLVGSTLRGVTPYSISFGNSLFAGTINDPVASAYFHLQNNNPGYALLIDKKAYFQHQINNLFFIPPLATISALIQQHEYFHARTKAAIALKTGKKQTIIGLATTEGLIDPTGVIFIARDPLLHAELFSKFLAENGRLIQVGDLSKLTNEEKKAILDLEKSQKEAAELYKAVRIIKEQAKKATKP